MISRGDVVWVDFGQPRGSEPAKVPALVLQEDWLLAAEIKTVPPYHGHRTRGWRRFPGTWQEDKVSRRGHRSPLRRPGDLLANLRHEVIALVEQYGARNPRVFGSVAQGVDTPWSDVDLLVTFPDSAARLAYFDLVEELEALLTVEVDVVDDVSTGRAAEQAKREALAL